MAPGSGQCDARVVRSAPRLGAPVGRPAGAFGPERTKAIQGVRQARMVVAGGAARSGSVPRRAGGSRGCIGRLPAGKAAS